MPHPTNHVSLTLESTNGLYAVEAKDDGCLVCASGPANHDVAPLAFSGDGCSPNGKDLIYIYIYIIHDFGA